MNFLSSKITTRKVMKILCLTGLFLVSAIGVLGQNTAQEQYVERERAAQLKRYQEDLERRRREEGFKRLRNMSNLMRQPQPNRVRTNISQQAFPGSRQLSESDKLLVAPETEFRAGYRDFLKQAKTGLLRLLADKCAGGQSNAAGCRASTLPDYGSAYSFRRGEYQWQEWADLWLNDDFFVSDAVFGQGWLVLLGDVEIENLTLTAKEAGFLSSITPANTLESAETQYQQSVTGIEEGKLLCRKFVPVLENAAYLLRSVAYRGKFIKYEQGIMPMDMTKGDTREDIIVAFRVLRKDADGSVTIVWKELSRKSAPEIKIEKRNKN
jgi:hypothetical protein